MQRLRVRLCTVRFHIVEHDGRRLAAELHGVAGHALAADPGEPILISEQGATLRPRPRPNLLTNTLSPYKAFGWKQILF